MLEISKFKKSTLGDSLSVILKHESNRVLWASVIVLSLGQSIYAQTEATQANPSTAEPVLNAADNDDVDPNIEALKAIVNASDFDQQFSVNAEQIQADLKAAQIESEQQKKQDLEVETVHSIMFDDTIPDLSASISEDDETDTGADALAIEVEEKAAPKKRSFLRKILRPFSSDSDELPEQDNIKVNVSVISVPADQVIQKIVELKVQNGAEQAAAESETTRAYNNALKLLQENIKNHLSTVKVDSLSQSASVVQQLKVQVNHAAEAVGFYESEIGDLDINTQTGTVSVPIKPKYIAYFDPSSLVAVRGPDGETSSLGVTPNFSKIVEIFPDFRIGDFLNQGAFEKMRARINTAAEEDGHFEGYWKTTSITDTEAGLKAAKGETEVEEISTENWNDFDQAILEVYDENLNASETGLTARSIQSTSQLSSYPVQAQLIYEAGERYKLGHVNFCTVDEVKAQEEYTADSELYETDKACPQNSENLPIRAEILQNMVPWLLPHETARNLHKEVTWKRSNDYAVWRINNLTSSLAGSRYFDKVEVVRKPDIYNLMSAAERKRKIAQEAAEPVTSVDSTLDSNPSKPVQDNLTASEQKTTVDPVEIKAETELPPKDKSINVDVIISADKRNITDLGLGYGTDTGARLRTQYRRSIVNERGHSFESNFELAEMRQALDGRYLIPHNHSVYDYFSLVGGYEREDRKGIVDGQGLLIESAVAGIDHVYTNPTGIWQHTVGLRYRLDRIDQNGVYDPDDKLDAFLRSGPEQQSLLFHLEASQSNSDDPVKPTEGFKQTYKVELGAEGFLTDANIAKVNAQWLLLKSFGASQKHQLLGETELGYIFTDNFDKVPYNLRYFAGGDNSIRGFDYKSLSPIEDGIKVGGQALARASLEYNYEVRPNWRIAAFGDVGNAYDEKFTNSTAYGAGLGIRWASPVGPMRIDVASGLSEDSSPIRLHFFIGTQF